MFILFLLAIFISASVYLVMNSPKILKRLGYVVLPHQVLKDVDKQLRENNENAAELNKLSNSQVHRIEFDEIKNNFM